MWGARLFPFPTLPQYGQSSTAGLQSSAAQLCRTAYREYAAKGLLPNGCTEITDAAFLWQSWACTVRVQLTHLLAWHRHRFICAASLIQPAKKCLGMGKGEVGRGKQAADLAAQLSLEGPRRKLSWKGRVGGGFKSGREGKVCSTVH